MNSNSYNLNPYTSGDLDLVVTQNLLNGFGRAVNGRNIRVQKNNIKVTDLQFKQQVITTVTAALNLYWDLVSFNQDLKAKQEEVATAQQLLQNNQEQVRIGTLAEIEVTRAQSQLYAAKQDLVISETNLLQQETVLKNALSRQGIATSDLADVQLFRWTPSRFPARTICRSVNDLTADALKNRLEIEQAKLNLDSNKMNLVGIKNSLKPDAAGLCGTDQQRLERHRQSCNALSRGNYGTLLGEIFRRDYPNYSAGVSLNDSAAQSRRAGGLCDQRDRDPAE